MLQKVKTPRFLGETLQWFRSYIKIHNGFYVHNKNKLEDFDRFFMVIHYI